MSTAVVAQFYAVYNEQRLELLDHLLAPTYVGQVNGREIVGVTAAKAFIQAFLTAGTTPVSAADAGHGSWIDEWALDSTRPASVSVAPITG